MTTEGASYTSRWELSRFFVTIIFVLLLSQSLLIPALSQGIVSPRLFKDQRAKLLKNIEIAKVRGVGVQNYMAAFNEIEEMVVTGHPEAEIAAKIETLHVALMRQLPDLERADELVVENHAARTVYALEQARVKILALINHDRKQRNLIPLTLDKTACDAGQKHCDEMVVNNYCSHWDCDGKKPDQRYCEAGGIHSVSENLAVTRTFNSHTGNKEKWLLVTDPEFSKEDLESMEGFFMTEKPPHDLHRRQILRPEHNKVGVGLSLARNESGETIVALAQEFVDDYGHYDDLPLSVSRTSPFTISGRLTSGLTVKSVSINWEPEPTPLTRIELLRKPNFYSLPGACVAEYSAESAPIRVWMNDNQQNFSVLVTPKDFKPGLYYVTVMARNVRSGKSFIVSTRTFAVQ